jgi:hypothetical protein
MEVKLHAFLILILEEGEFLDSDFDRFTPSKKKTLYTFYRRLSGLQNQEGLSWMREIVDCLQGIDGLLYIRTD